MIMHRKQLPEHVCEQARELFGPPSAIAERRAQATAEAQTSLGLNETQLVCMVFAPFVERGAGLEHFLRCCHPGMLVAMPDLHKAMQGATVADQVAQWMVDVSGLSIDMLGRLYGASVALPEYENTLGTDPQQAVDNADTEAPGLLGRDGLREGSGRY